MGNWISYGPTSRGPMSLHLWRVSRGPHLQGANYLKICYVLKILLIEYILHQLISSFHRSIYIPGGAGFQPSTVVLML